MSLAVEVRWMSGDKLCCITTATKDTCGRDLKLIIASETGICECRFVLVAGNIKILVGTPMAKIKEWMGPGNIVYAIRRSIHANGSNAADLIARGFCLKCMKEAGVRADEILALPRDIDAGVLKAAGYSLNELLCARARLPHLLLHTPATTRTLFDWQLQLARSSAKEFRAAGFRAEDLSYKHFIFPFTQEELSPRDRVWAETCASFTATQLREANYTYRELRCADFSDEDLREAGFAVREQQRAVPANVRPRLTIRKKRAVATKTMPRRLFQVTMSNDFSVSQKVSFR